MKNILEKFGSFGAILAAMACPVCFPKLALVGAILGMGALKPFETVFFFGSQLLVLSALGGHGLSYKKHQNKKLLSLAIVSALTFFVSLYVAASEILSYLAFGGLIVATVWLVAENRRCAKCETTLE